MNITKLSSILPEKELLILAKGETKSGKSIFAASFPKPLFIMFERRIKPVQTYMKRYFPERMDEISFAECERWFDYMQIMKNLQNDCPYETIVIDSLTSAGRAVIAHILNATMGKADKGRSIAGIRVPGIEEFLGEDGAINQMLSDLLRLRNKNLIMIAHVTEVSMRDIRSNQTTVTRSLVTGIRKLAAAIPGYFDEIYHFDVQSNLEASAPPKYTFITKNAGDDFAGTAFQSLPRRVDFTNKLGYAVLMDFIREEVGSVISTRKETIEKAVKF